jgi:V/A-type H+-transporting ATPase subunit C
MPSSSYSSSFGRLQSLSTNFLSKDAIQNLMKSEDVTEMVRILESTWYGPEIERASALYPPPENLEVALNRRLVEINKIVLETVPFNGKTAIRAYLLKWDIHNIELILSSKIIGRTITETEPFLVSSRNFPAGISAGNISHDEMKIILSQSGVEGVVNYLVKYKYGSIIMKHFDNFQKTKDLSQMMVDLLAYYYTNLLESLKFFQGDEGIIRDVIRAQIDKKNIMSLLKGKDSNLDRELVKKHIIEGGHIPLNVLLEMFGSKNIEEFVNRIEEHLIMGDLLEPYRKTRSLIDFEVSMDQFINIKYVQKLKNIALSIGYVFHFIFQAEYEWYNIKRIAYGKRYGLPVDRIKTMLVFE